jgi:hypothetical protein
LIEKASIFLAAGEVAAAAKQECLFDVKLEMPVGRFRVTVLMCLSHIDPLGGQTVVGEQVTITSLKLSSRRQIVHGCAQAIGSMALGHPPELPQRILQTVGKRLE